MVDGQGQAVQKKPMPAPQAGPAKDSAIKAPAFWTNSVQFLREVKIELKKVTWPSRKQTMGSTLVVIILVVIISSFLGLVDMGLTGAIKYILQ